MNVTQTLIELQDVDGQIRELEREAKDIPTRKAQETARLGGVNAELQIAKDRLAAQQQRIKSDEEEAAQHRERAREIQIAQASIKSNKELQQSVQQVEGILHDAEVAENRAIAREDELPELRKAVEAAQARVEADQGGVNGYVSELDERLREVQMRLEALMKEREEKAAAVKVESPKAYLYYERLRTKRWPVLVPLNGDDVCDGCHMKQPPFVAQMVAHVAKQGGKDLATCTMCGRMLYSDF